MVNKIELAMLLVLSVLIARESISVLWKKETYQRVYHFGWLVIFGTMFLSVLVLRDLLAHYMSLSTSNPQGLEWGGIDHWAYLPGFATGGTICVVGLVMEYFHKTNEKRQRLVNPFEPEVSVPAQGTEPPKADGPIDLDRFRPHNR